MKKLTYTQFKNRPEYDRHLDVYELREPDDGFWGYIAIHRKNIGKPSFGATRFWHYSKREDALGDALNLSKMMSYKAAISGLPYGGAKGVIIAPRQCTPSQKNKMLKAYAEAINSLEGSFITGTDVGLDLKELKLMRSVSPNVVGVTADPTKFTALGLYLGIQTALKEVFGNDSLVGKSFAIQGMGKIGTTLLDLIYPQTTNIYISDISSQRVYDVKKNYPKVTVVKSSHIHGKPVDVFSPCALSGVINGKSVGELNCAIVAGGANNQLGDKKDGYALYGRGILYASDYVINAGGLISVADEYENKRYNESRVTKKVQAISRSLEKIFSRSKRRNISPNEVSDEMAEKIFNIYQNYEG